MKKIIALSFAFAFSFGPLSAQAVVNSINGQTALDQFLVSPGSNAQNSMHMDIIQVGTDTHRYRWDGSPWRADQGGTGLLDTPTFGQVLVGDGTGAFTLMGTSSLGILAEPGGESGQVQFNDNGVLGGIPMLFSIVGEDIALTAQNLLGLHFNTDSAFNVRVAWDEENSGLTSLVMDAGAALNVAQSQFRSELELHAGQILLNQSDDLNFQRIDLNSSTLSLVAAAIGGGFSRLELDEGTTAWTASDAIQIVRDDGQDHLGLTLAEGVATLFATSPPAIEDERSELSVGNGTVTLFGENDLGDRGELTVENGEVTLSATQSISLMTDEGPVSIVGSFSTTTINIGAIGDVEGRSCFNTKNTDGQDISFYFVGTTMVVENNVCL